MITDDEKLIKRVLDELGIMIKDIPFSSSPPETGRLIYKRISEITGVEDPFKEVKDKYIKIALDLYPFLKKKVNESQDRLLTAIRLSIAGNVIDFGANQEFELEKEIDEILEKDFAVNDYREFCSALENTDKILYIGDNAGETVFDRILIEEMKKPVLFVVRDRPIINDATYDDAVKSGLNKVAKIVSSGTDAPGTVLSTCSEKFLKIYNNAKFIISKGQGNYETLSEENHPIFFLLKVKCPVIARDIGVKNGDIVLKMIKSK
jgi:hypothetical protein